MRLKTWLISALGLGTLLVLLVVSMLASSGKAQDIYAQLDDLNSHHRRVETRLRRLRSEVNLSGIFVRDYLLDAARDRAPDYRERIAEFRQTNMSALSDLQQLLGPNAQISSLRAELDAYWTAFDPLFDWNAAEKGVRSAGFLQREVVPRRDAVLSIAREIEELNNANLAMQRDEVARRYSALRHDLRTLLWQTVLLGLAVTTVVILRLRVLERRSAAAERQMHDLSRQLVNTQEEERKNLSRELHDHVAQVLTGLRMELGRIERMSATVGPAVAESKRLVDDLFGTVRTLALGLRPSMLDDVGLEAALAWHVRDFMKRYAIDVSLRMEGQFDGLCEKLRTCVFRIVQEAMTNCVRHACADRLEIAIAAQAGQLTLSVRDNGIGLDPTSRRKGLGLSGIDERVKELGGAMALSGAAGGGTTLAVSLPLTETRELSHARNPR